MKLRPYQREAIDSLAPYFSRGGNGPLIVLPTGTGKSVVLGEFVREACQQWPTTHILVLTHDRRLVGQDAKKIAECWPSAPLGVYSAGLKMRQLRQITVASIQSVYKKKHFYGRFDLIIIDEAHMIPHESAGMYRMLLDGSIAANPDVKLIGLTATHYRTKGGMLHEGDGALFDGIAYEYDIAEAIDDGYLARLSSKEGDEFSEIDPATGKARKTTGGDFNLGQLGESMSAIDLVEHHADEIVKLFARRRKWLVFCVTVQHAQLITAALQRRGITADYVCGDSTIMSDRDVDEKLRKHRIGETQCMVNMGILTTGYDDPDIDAIACLRPTKAPGLYVQIGGRGTRPVYAPGFDLEAREGRLAAIAASYKPNCLFADFGGNVKRHGFIDKVQPPRKGQKGGPQEMPAKKCPKCATLVPIMTRFCKELLDDGSKCGHEFEIAPRESETVAHSGAILSTEVPPVELDIEKIFYVRHDGKRGMPTLRVDYYAGMQRVSEYVCVEHEGYARVKAERWWSRRCPYPMPETVDEAVEAGPYLAKVRKLVVSFASKYPEILKAEF